MCLEFDPPALLSGQLGAAAVQKPLLMTNNQTSEVYGLKNGKIWP